MLSGVQAALWSCSGLLQGLDKHNALASILQKALPGDRQSDP